MSQLLNTCEKTANQKSAHLCPCLVIIQWRMLKSVPMRLGDAAAVWLMHTRVHRAGKCSKTEIKKEDMLFIVSYPLVCACLGAKSQHWDFVKGEYLYANSGHYASRSCEVKHNYEDYISQHTLNSD